MILVQTKIPSMYDRWTHWGLYKMAAILQTSFSNAFSWMKYVCILIQISLKFITKGVIKKKTSLAEVMAWCRTGDKPLPEPMMTMSTASASPLHMMHTTLYENHFWSHPQTHDNHISLHLNKHCNLKTNKKLTHRHKENFAKKLTYKYSITSGHANHQIDQKIGKKFSESSLWKIQRYL